MNETPNFDIEKIIKTYTSPKSGSERAKSVFTLMKNEGFVNARNTFALIGTGGTLSSGYSPRQETIVPGKYRAAEHVLNDLKNKFKIIPSTFSSIDVFAKDSRNIENSDLILLLDTLHTMKNERVLIVSGTYMLPLITELLMGIDLGQSKILGVTGSMLPSGFTLTDAPINIVSTVTAINQRHAFGDINASNVMAVFHGQIYDTLEGVKSLDLHPAQTDNLVIGYPHISAPADNT